MTFGSLFTGIGGIDLGLERAGFQCRWKVENDPYCVKVLAKRWPHVKRYGDIRTVTGDQLEWVDCLAGGFPCQDVSQAGKRAGIEGTRSGLWSEYARLIGELRPRWVLIENVSGLLVYPGIQRVIGELARRGYVGCWRCLRASDFGASHLRKRVFIIAMEHSRREGRGIDHDHAELSGGLQSQPGERRDQVVAYRSGEGRRQDAGRTPCDEATHGGAGRDIRQPDGNYEPASGGSGVAHREHEGRILGGTAHHRNGNHASGYDANGCDPHVAYGESGGLRIMRQPSGCNGLSDGCHSQLADAERTGLEVRDRIREQPLRQDAEPLAPGLPHVAHGDLSGCGRSGRSDLYREGQPGQFAVPRFAPGPNDPRWPAILRERPDLAPALAQIRGVADGVPDWMDGAMSNRTKRLGRLGNAVVPDCAEWAGYRIREFEETLCRS